MRLFAISDVHVGFKANRALLEALPAHPDDWLIVAGDVGESLANLDFTFETLGRKFARLIWVPGNHELWTVPKDPSATRGVARYEELVAHARGHGVLTPEDPYVLFRGEGGPAWIAPLFVGYDYTFAPDAVGPEGALAWALEKDLLCADEHYLHPDPHPSKAAWCRARVVETEARLDALDGAHPTILVNHFPLHEAHAFLPRIPRFKIWCGTRATEAWPARYRAQVVVYGHLHVPSTRWLDGVRYEEVSTGYPKQWRNRRGIEDMLRPILPAPATYPFDWDALVEKYEARERMAKALREAAGEE